MPANVQITDDRYQFIAGNKYWVIGSVVMTGTYVTGGIPISFTDGRNPKPVGSGTLKASRPPWWSSIGPDGSGNTYTYTPTTGVKILGPGGVELTNGAALPATPVNALFIFQGME